MVFVDRNLCIGCAICVNLCPEGFAMKDGIAYVTDSDADCVDKAMEECPTGAIKEDGLGENELADNDMPPSNMPRAGRGKGRGMGRGPMDGRGAGKKKGGRKRR